jgi:hypothetical protein
MSCNAKYNGGKRRKSMKKMMKGGNGAAQHAIATYGGIGEQTAQAGTNVIAANATQQVGGDFNVAPANPIAQMGGKKRGRKQMGGLGFGDLAVPAVLLVANQYGPKGHRQSTQQFSRRRSTRRRSTRRR